MKNIKTILADDHKGNKAIILVQGHFTPEMLENMGTIKGSAITELQNKMMDVLKHSTVKVAKD